MPIIIALLTALGGAVWWYIRSNPRGAMDAAGDLVDTVRNAPRRLAFRKQTTQHAVEGVDDPRIALAGIAMGFLELDDLPTRDDRDRFRVLLRTKLRLDAAEAEETEVLARWLLAQCDGPKPGIARLARRLYKIDGDANWDVLADMLSALSGDTLSDRQRDAVEDLRIAFRRPVNR